MASSADYVEFVCGQIHGAGAVRHKKMFGEYMVYVNDKPILLVCDNTVYVKILSCLDAFMTGADRGFPYNGAKEHYILDIEDRELSLAVAAALLEVTPLPKPKVKKPTGTDSERVRKMPFSSVYPLLVQKAERKGRAKEEVDAAIFWLTGYDERGLREQLEKHADHETFYGEAPGLNPDAGKITGVVCGVRVEEIADPIMLEVRRLDKLVDELAKGKPLEKVLRP